MRFLFTDINPYLCTTNNMKSVRKRHHYKWVSHEVSVNWNSRVVFFIQLYKLLRWYWKDWETRNYGWQRKGNCIIKRHPCAFPLFVCRQTSTHLTKNIHVLRAILYLPSPSQSRTPSSPSLMKFSEEVLKSGIPAGCRTEEKILMRGSKRKAEIS